MTKDEALKLALEALQKIYIAPEHEEYIRVWWPACEQAITAIKEALAQPEQEPVAWQERKAKRMHEGVVTEWTNWYPCRYRTIDEAKAEACDHIPYEWRPLYTTPPQRKPLTDEEIERACVPLGAAMLSFSEVARAIEAAHGIKE